MPSPHNKIMETQGDIPGGFFIGSKAERGDFMRRRRNRYLSMRQREARRIRIRRRILVTGLVLGLASLAMSLPLRARIKEIGLAGIQAMSVFAPQGESVDVILPQMTVYALQLGVYDNGESAQAQQTGFQQLGIPCVIWQREKMRLVCDASLSRGGLNTALAAGAETYVFSETLPEVTLRISAAQGETQAVGELLLLPDEMARAFDEGNGELEPWIAAARSTAEAVMAVHPEHALCMQLAQSMLRWCDMMEAAPFAQEQMQAYAAVTMWTLCRELRYALVEIS